jgi:magnesium transporter
MVTRHTGKAVTWVDLESPTRAELRAVLEEFSIDTRIEEEIISPTPYPVEVSFPHYLYLILHFPTTDPSGAARNQEIDFIVGKKFIITVRYEVIDSIHNLHKVFEAEELLGLPGGVATAPDLLERIFRRLYGAIREEIEYMAGTLERIEADIFAGKERMTVQRISKAGRILLRFETAIMRHREPLQIFLSEICTTAFFGKTFSEHAQHIQAERDHAASLVASYRSAATELRNTNDSLLSSSQNEITRTLTILAFATFPLSIIVGVFGMNTSHLPIIDSPYAFWIILGIMAVTVTIFIGYFRWRRWL